MMNGKAKLVASAVLAIVATTNVQADERDEQIESLKQEVGRLRDLLNDAQKSIGRLEKHIAGVERSESTEPMPTDDALARTIIERLTALRKTGLVRGYNITLRVEDGVVTLEGTVQNQEQWQLVEKAVSRTMGVRRVINEVAIRDARVFRLFPTNPATTPKVHYSTYPKVITLQPGSPVDEGMMLDALESQQRLNLSR